MNNHCYKCGAWITNRGHCAPCQAKVDREWREELRKQEQHKQEQHNRANQNNQSTQKKDEGGCASTIGGLFVLFIIFSMFKSCS